MMMVVMTISKSGVYKLRGNISGSTTDSVISISASEVELNLGGYVLTQSNTAGDGINIAGGVSNVIVCNGIVRGPGSGASYGVFFSGSSSVISKIILDDLCIENWGGAGIYASCAVGTKGTDIEIKNCVVTECVWSRGIYLVYCERANIHDCLLINNSNDIVLDLVTCNECVVSDVFCIGNSPSSSIATQFACQGDGTD